MTALIVFAHGSSVPSANDSVHAVARDLAAKGGYECVEAAFLEAAQPDLEGAIAMARDRGATRAVIIPYFLTLGIHLQRDLPGIVQRLSSIYTNVSIVVTDPLEGHPGLLDALYDRAKAALNGSSDSEGQTD